MILEILSSSFPVSISYTYFNISLFINTKFAIYLTPFCLYVSSPDSPRMLVYIHVLEVLITHTSLPFYNSSNFHQELQLHQLYLPHPIPITSIQVSHNTKSIVITYTIQTPQNPTTLNLELPFFILFGRGIHEHSFTTGN